MIAFSIIMFAIALLFIVLGILIYRGRTELIHDYHQTRVKDKKAYGKAMGKALIGMTIPMIVSGVIGLFTTSALVTVILIAGLIISFIPMVVVQKKHNGGMF